MKIAVLTDGIAGGGAEKVAWALAQSMAERHEIHVITTTADSARTEYRSGITIHSLHTAYPIRWQGWLSLYNPQTVGPVRRILQALQPDVVHAHNVHHGLSYSALSTARRLGLPTVFTAHDMMSFTYGKLTHFIDPTRCSVSSPEAYRLPPGYNLRLMRLRFNPFRSLAIRRILQQVQVRTCISEAQRQALEVNGLPPFRLIYNGIEPAQIDCPPDVVERLRDRLELRGRQVILFAGRITREKGSGQILAALAQLVQRRPSALLLVLSVGGLEGTAFESPQFAALCQHHVQIGGWLTGEELAAAYRLADIVTIPSVYLEPAGMIQLEAMAAAKPVIATCYGGPPEIVLDGETGYVINPFDTDQFAARLDDLLGAPLLRARFGEAGRQRLLSHFTLVHQSAEMLQAYKDAIHKG